MKTQCKTEETTGSGAQVHAIDIDDQPTPGAPTILFCDDMKPIRDKADELLRNLGYNVILAASAGQALAIWLARQEEITVVVLDFNMPGEISEIEALDQMRAIDPEVRVAFFCSECLVPEEAATKGTTIIEKDGDWAGFLRSIFWLIETQNGNTVKTGNRLLTQCCNCGKIRRGDAETGNWVRPRGLFDAQEITGGWCPKCATEARKPGGHLAPTTPSH